MPASSRCCLILTALFAAGAARAEISIEMHAISADGVGNSLGTVTANDTDQGLLLTPKLTGLTAGEHGFHVHTNPDCGAAEKDGKKVAGLAAGGHFDPAGTNAHKGPHDNTGHQGDLPVLVVNADGTTTTPVLAARLKEADLKGRSLMIHGGGDNYSDQPKPLGGGGARVACGVIP